MRRPFQHYGTLQKVFSLSSSFRVDNNMFPPQSSSNNIPNILPKTMQWVFYRLMVVKHIVAATVCPEWLEIVSLLMIYHCCLVWSNFEIGDLNFWRGEAYMKYFEYLDRAGGFYYEVCVSLTFLYVCNTDFYHAAVGWCPCAQHWCRIICPERPDSLLQRHWLSSRTLSALPPRRGSRSGKMLVWRER